ncbi:MAG: 5-(carboxyamino)imidazole ribonucleotide synthase [Cyanobacteria bacterium QS_8_64_29]|nr:MAG: 5-(carboxyamino)imidazole ribonucleotide synthase [Cyanobacteria bacterium QS_8_64_29]
MAVARVGILGGGQLARMLAAAAEPLGLEAIVQTASEADPAVATASDAILVPLSDAAATARLAERCDVLTFENESIDLALLQPLAQQGTCFRPSLASLEPLLDKYRQRCCLQALGLPTPRFAALTAGGDCEPDWGFPAVLKARRHGYDGYGTTIVADRSALEASWAQQGHPAMLLEEYVPYERELAIMAARNLSGEIAVFPLVETQQQDQVCHCAIVPAPVSEGIREQAEAMARTLLWQLQIVGTFGIEFFLRPSGELLVNEVAPRTHNSGHYSLDACDRSQFELQLRAIADWPLGQPQLRWPGAVMINLLGYEYAQDAYSEKRAQLAAVPQARVHWYGKQQSRPGRKLGHVTVPLESGELGEAQALGDRVAALWYP